MQIVSKTLSPEKPKNKELLTEILGIALPAIGGFLGLILFDFIDIFWIEKLGSQAVASVASAGFIIGSVYSLMMIPSSGCSALVSQFYGAGMRSRCWEVIIQSSWLGFLMGCAILLGCLPFVNIPFELMGLDADSSQIAVEYLRILLYGMPFIFLDMLFGNIFNSYGDNKISNIIMILCLIINGVLDPMLMFGWLGCPKLGVEGAAYATLIGHLVSFITRAILLRKRNYIPPLKYFFTKKVHYLKEILKIGLPNAAASWVWSMVYPILMRQITPFGVIQVSAIGVCHRLESLPYFVAQGFGIASTSLVGYYLGKHETEKIDKVVDYCLYLSSITIVPFMIFYLFLPHRLIMLLSDKFDLIDAGAGYLYIVGVFEIFMCYENLLNGVFTGLGKTLPTTLVTMPLTIGRIPLAWFFATYLGWGINGIWWAISFSTFLKGLGLIILYKYYKMKTNNFETLAVG